MKKMVVDELRLYEELKEAYETTTHKVNRFLNKINSIKWDCSFTTSDETIMYCLGDFSLEVYNSDGKPNPFTQFKKPDVMFSDNSILEL